jgi:hypothetical protein
VISYLTNQRFLCYCFLRKICVTYFIQYSFHSVATDVLFQVYESFFVTQQTLRFPSDYYSIKLILVYNYAQHGTNMSSVY